METRTVNMASKPIRLLKKMRKYHRKLRSHPLHREAFHMLVKAVKSKQEKFAEQCVIFHAARNERILKTKRS